MRSSRSASLSFGNRFTPTTTGRPNARDDVDVGGGSRTPAEGFRVVGGPATVSGTPPWALRARTVATSSAADGANPAERHTMWQNFSNPRSDPKPASVATRSADFIATRSAMIELLAWAMLPKGPAWTTPAALERLHQVRPDGVLEDHGHRAGHLEVARR